jgi:hypothetical protein
MGGFDFPSGVAAAVARPSINGCLTFVKDIFQKLGEFGKVFWVIFKQLFCKHY